MSKKQAIESTGPALPVIQLALDQILVDESKNMRRFPPSAKSIQEMANSIKANGMLQHMIVQPIGEPNGDGKTHELVAGFRRYKALQLLSETGDMAFDTIPVTVGERPGWVLNLVENKDRQEPSAIDYAYAITTRVAAGEEKQAIAKEIGKTPAWVTQISKMVELRAEVQKKIHNGDIPVRLARELPLLTEEEQDERIAKFEAGMGATEVAEESARKRRGKKGKKNSRDEGSSIISAKSAVKTFEAALAEYKEVEKPNKTQERVITLYQALVKFMNGGLGAKALDNRLVELL